jgi:transaldolase
MFGIEQAAEALEEAADRVDVDALDGTRALHLVELLARVERKVAGARTVVTRRVEETKAWRRTGYRTMAEWLAATNGSTLGDAIGSIETARALPDLPRTEAAFRAGEISAAQAPAVSAAAVEDADVEASLLDTAKTQTVRTLRQRSRPRCRTLCWVTRCSRRSSGSPWTSSGPGPPRPWSRPVCCRRCCSRRPRWRCSVAKSGPPPPPPTRDRCRPYTAVRRAPGHQATGGSPIMKPTQHLHDIGQSLWLDNIRRDLLTSGTLKHYIDDFSVTGLTSNPTIFDEAFKGSSDYDDSFRTHMKKNLSAEDLFFELALEDLTEAADLFRPGHEATTGIDGWVSLEVSPKLAYKTKDSVAQAKRLHDQADRPNLFIKIPGTEEGLPAIEQLITDGIAVNVTLLFAAEHYQAAAEAYVRAIETRVDAGLSPDVPSVASVFISRWDKAIADQVPAGLKDRLGIAVAKRTYRCYRELLASDRWQRLENLGARPQRLLWASTGTKDPDASDVLYISSLPAPHTINTMPEKTLLAFADHGKVGDLLPPDGGDAEVVLAEFRSAGIDVDALGAKLQRDGADAFVKSWDELLVGVETKAASLR